MTTTRRWREHERRLVALRDRPITNDTERAMLDGAIADVRERIASAPPVHAEPRRSVER